MHTGIASASFFNTPIDEMNFAAYGYRHSCSFRSVHHHAAYLPTAVMESSTLHRTFIVCLVDYGGVNVEDNTVLWYAEVLRELRCCGTQRGNSSDSGRVGEGGVSGARRA